MAATMQDSKFGNRLFLTPRVPQGLAAAVEGLTREVIRNRPENIYVFAAHHFEKLLRLREQYDDTIENKKNMKVLQSMNEAMKERNSHVKSKDMNDFVQHSGWSLNETAKVLDRHRSIFGETGQKISTDEVRELANESIITSSKVQQSPKKKTEKCSPTDKNVTQKYATSSSNKKRESPRTTLENLSGTGKHESRNAPKIISQIPLAKDIKTELKKNRISSKERKKVDEKKMQVACEYSREITIEKTSRRSVERTKRNYETRSEQRKSSRTESSTKKRTETSTDKTDSPRVRKSSRSLSMDRVKNYVVQNFVGMTSLDELQSPSYVEKVQEVIDETSTIIKEKVEALKTGVVKAKEKQLSKEQSSSSDERSKASNKSLDSSRRSRGSLRENVSKIVQSDAENSQSLDDNRVTLEQTESKISDNSDASNESKISLPAVRPPSSKSTSRSLSARSDSNGLVLPPISPESTKSPKVKEELVLPVLSPPRSTTVTPDASVDFVNPNEKVEQKAHTNKEEEFQDSLNVTPDLLNAPQRPDSLETSDVANDSDSSDHASPLETLKGKLLEIEQVQKRIAGVLDDNISNEDKISKETEINAETGTAKIQDKLLEIQETEKRIEQILDSQTTIVDKPEATHSDIKSKLQELENAEKRIQDIFVNESDKENSNETSSTKTNVKSEDNTNSSHKINEKANEESAQKDLEVKNNNGNSDVAASSSEEKKYIALHAESVRALSPHSYILTEGSPHDIPDSVTTVIIPDRIPTPDSDTLQVELENEEVYSTLIPSKELVTKATVDNDVKLQNEEKPNIHEAFGEAVDTENIETSTVDVEFIRGIRENHDKIVSRQDLGLIQEERDEETGEAEVIDSEDEKVLKVVTSSLEDILEKDKVEYVVKDEVEVAEKSIPKDETDEHSTEAIHATESESTDETKETSITDGVVEITEVVENSLDIEETTARSAESTNEIKETSITTDRSSLSFDPAVPIVPELNLDSLPDETISSFNITDDEQKGVKSQKESKDTNSSEALISSGDTKESASDDKRTPEENLEKETQFNEENVHKTVTEHSSEKSNIISMVLVEELTEEYIERLETEEYEKLEKSVITNKSDLITDDKTVETQSSIDSGKTEERVIEQINVHNDTPIDVPPIHSDIQAVNTNEGVEAVPDDINNVVYDETEENKQTTQTVSERQDIVSAHESNSADSSSRELENVHSATEPSRLVVIDNDQTSQLVDLSRASSQCTTTRRLDSDDHSIKTNADETALQNNQSQNADTIREAEPIVTEKSSDDLRVSDADQTSKQEIENHDDEKKECHIYVPEMNTSKDVSSSSESSTFMSAATKIQAGVRGFLTRRRLQSTQRRSSTLDSVSSIQESFVEDESSVPAEATSAATATSTKTVLSPTPLSPIVETTGSPPEGKARKKLRREDAVQRTTLSVENAFAENQLQHTGEFHDCIPLPVFDDELRTAVKEQNRREKETIASDKRTANVEQLLGKILLGHAAAATTSHFPGPSNLGPFVDVVLLPGDAEAMLQRQYLNFITSVEDVTNELFNDIPGTPKGVIIEEITSLDENKSTGLPSTSENASDNTISEDPINAAKNNESSSEELPQQTNQENDNKSNRLSTSSGTEKTGEQSYEENRKTSSPAPETGSDINEVGEASSLIEASITTSEEPLSMNIEEVLGLGEENEKSRKAKESVIKVTGLDVVRSSSTSQESHLSDERTRSPVTMMQIAPKSVEEKSEKSDKSEDEKNKRPDGNEANEL